MNIANILYNARAPGARIGVGGGCPNINNNPQQSSIQLNGGPTTEVVGSLRSILLPNTRRGYLFNTIRLKGSSSSHSKKPKVSSKLAKSSNVPRNFKNKVRRSKKERKIAGTFGNANFALHVPFWAQILEKNFTNIQVQNAISAVVKHHDNLIINHGIKWYR